MAEDTPAAAPAVAAALPVAAPATTVEPTAPAAPVAAPTVVVPPSDAGADAGASASPPPDASAAAPASDPTTLLTEPAAEPAKPADAAPKAAAEPAKPADAAPKAAEQPPEPTPLKYEPFKFAEGLVVPENDPGLAKFGEIAGSLNIPQDKAQELVNLYGEAAKKFTEDFTAAQYQKQRDAFADQVRGWEKEFLDSPEFKNRTDTAINDAQWAMAQFGGTKAQQEELGKFLLNTGAGSHRSLIRIFANVAKTFREARPGPKPLPNNGSNASPAERRYVNMGRGDR